MENNKYLTTPEGKAIYPYLTHPDTEFKTAGEYHTKLECNLEDSKPGEKNYSLSIGQIYNFQENSSLPSTSSLDQKASDLVGEAYLRLSDNFTLNNKFSVDHNFNDINYNDLEANLILGNTSFNLNYLEESNHVGTSNYIKSGVKVNFNNSGELTFDIKKNLETDSTEFYDLAYDYVNDCLKAGLLFRREFYSDKDVEASDSLIFRITLFPFGEAKSPLIDRWRLILKYIFL